MLKCSRNGKISLRELPGNFDGFVLGPVAKNVNAVRCRQNIDFREVLAEKRIQQRRFSRFHFADNDEEERLANVRQQTVKRVERRGLTAHFRREPQQFSERSFELGPNLQVIIGDHAGRPGFKACLSGQAETRSAWRSAKRPRAQRTASASAESASPWPEAPSR